ncbi:sterigmatocystin biosynthesis P450 monooxygenase StcS [Hypoxylon sp. NC0597]|nr:sterigmatocystin biosynthesis P450 monooxygenase StcS [Hypoxylon sp. NC0597]
MAFFRIDPSVMGLLLSTSLILLVGWVVYFLYKGVMMRWRFHRMKAQGIPIPEPYSLIFGHLPLLISLNEGYPSDTHSNYAFKRLIQNWQKYYPAEPKCPPLIYLDLWPFMPEADITVVSPELCHQFTQETPLPRHIMFKWAMMPVTGGIDLLSMNMVDHRVWRARLNPAFSTRNIFSNVPGIVEEVSVFARLLKEMAGSSGDWGQMFTLYPRACNLTFDVILRFVLGIRSKEQTEGPSLLLQALRNLIRHTKTRNLTNMIKRLRPSYKRDVARNSKIIRDILMPELLKCLKGADDTRHNTVVDFAIKDVTNEKETPNSEFMDTLIATIKGFLFAGHDTTAQTICYLFWEVNKTPGVWSKLRAEHDDVLGPDPRQAGEILRENPHKINELRYTTAVVKETLRMHGLGSTFRQGSHSFNFVWEGKLYPTYDALVQTIPTAMLLHPDLWPRVNDFLPERYLVPEGDPLRPIENAWRPFEMGTMRCIGEGLAMMELSLVLVFTARELDFDFNYSEWDRLQNRDPNKPPSQVDGERAYRCGEGAGCVKDQLPTRVRTRS